MKQQQQQQQQLQQQQKLKEVQHYSDDPDKLLNEWLGELENLIGVSFLDSFSPLIRFGILCLSLIDILAGVSSLSN